MRKDETSDPRAESLAKTDVLEDGGSNAQRPAIILGNTPGRKANDAVCFEGVCKGDEE